MNKYIDIKQVRYPYIAKCECCNRVKDIFYKSTILDVESKEKENREMVVGDLDFCKNCGENFSRAIGNIEPIDEHVIKEFKF